MSEMVKLNSGEFPKPCIFCEKMTLTRERVKCSIIRPKYTDKFNNLWSISEQTFHDILKQIIHQGYCTKHPGIHNNTACKYLNGAALKSPTKRCQKLYLDLFKNGYTYDELVARSTAKNISTSVDIPLCNVLALGYKLDFEKCGIPISNEMEEQAMKAIYAEVEERQAIPHHFNTEPHGKYAIFIYAKMRGIYTRRFENHKLCAYACGEHENLPLFCKCNMCKKDISEHLGLSPVQGKIITPAQRKRVEVNRQAALAIQRKRKRYKICFCYSIK